MNPTVPPACSVQQRIAMTARCRDCDPVAKVADAGAVVSDDENRRLQIMHNGLRVLADGYYGPWMTDLIGQCRGHHEPQEERVFHEVLKHLPRDATMIELGAYWAYYSLWFLMDNPERRAIGLEPEPLYLELGRQNAMANGLALEHLHAFTGRNAAPVARFEADVAGPIDIPCHTVASIMEKSGIDHLTLLHCDVQGAEVDVLDSCRTLFRNRKIDWVFVSTHAHQISGDPLTHQRAVTILQECGARIEIEHDVHESFSGDGLIVARFCAAPAGWRPPAISYNRHSTSLFRHLAHDLEQARRKSGDMHDPSRATLSPCGALFKLSGDCPLGAAGEHLVLPNDNVMAPEIIARGAWDFDKTELFVSRMADAASTVIDIGANVGLFSRQVDRLTQGRNRFVCVEPDATNFSALQFNLSAFGPRISLHNVALGADDADMEFYRDTENAGNYSLNPDALRARDFETVSVPVRAAAGWFRRTLPQDAARLALKTDTQGHDEIIVCATPDWVWSRVEVALIELWRIEKPAVDVDVLRTRLDAFPNRQLGEERDVSTDDILAYLDASDWQFRDLLMWR